MIPWHRFVEIVRSHQRFLLTSHVRPDGDALGSELVMARALQSLGKDVRVCNAFATPPNLRFLDTRKDLKQLAVDVPATDFDDREVLIIVDTTAWAQLGTMGDVVKQSKALKVVIDHHQGGDDLGAELFKDSDAEATGRLVVEAVDQLGVPLSEEIAIPAFVAIATDTGWFRFSSTTPGTLRLASRLVEAGAAPAELYKQLYETDSLGRLQLIGRAFTHTKTELGGRLIYTWLEQADFSASEAIPSDSEDIINMTLAVGGAEMAVILVEQPRGGFKVSLRSRCEVDCSQVASQFGGGGHRRAAGAFFEEPLESARAKILGAVRAAMTSDMPPSHAAEATAAERR
ncbi:MAG: bifunctional oligoribonuclease/PAP phosphatase NrnA [Planctomycetaceae bacterium]|nr:bifunctional oligoribonuclease/PAP phosphatase NrnA [Planctomycetaceae bacterium]